MNSQKPETPATPNREGPRSPTAGTVRSGKLVVVVFVLSAAGLIGGSAALLRWAKNRSYESLVHPPGVTSAPSVSPSGDAAPNPQKP